MMVMPHLLTGDVVVMPHLLTGDVFTLRRLTGDVFSFGEETRRFFRVF